MTADSRRRVGGSTASGRPAEGPRASCHARPIGHLGRVVLRWDRLLEHVGFLPHGSSGTVLATLSEGTAYLVEFADPFPIRVPLSSDEILDLVEDGPENRTEVRTIAPPDDWEEGSAAQ